jgi:hypothetical protein
MGHALVDSTNVTLDQHGRPIITTHVHFVALRMTLGQLCSMLTLGPTIA